MPKSFIKRKFLIAAFTFLISVTFLPPVSANFFPFRSKKTISPSEYSNRQDDIEIYNNQAIELFEEGHFKEAQELWEKAIRVMERSGSYIPQHSEADEKYLLNDDIPIDFTADDMAETSEIEDLYTTAVAAFKKQKYTAAKKLFDRVETKTPDYRATRNYLTILKHKIKRAEQSLNGHKFKEGALSRKAERGEWKKILKESESELERKLIDQVSPLYKEALRHYKSRNFKLAKEYFQEIDSIFPKYRDTLKYISRIDVDIRDEEKRALKESYKKQAIARKKEQDEWHRIIEESEKKLEEKMKQQAEPVYHEALHYYKQREFEMAKNRFEEVRRIFPEYKSTAKYLGRIGQDMKDEIERQERQRVREYEQEVREKEIARKREKKHLEHLRGLEEKNRLRIFEEEVAARRRDREEWLLVLKESESERQKKLTAQADFIYQEAVEYFKKRRFEEARENFLEVESVLSDYKSTEKYLSKIDHEIAKEEQQLLIEQERKIKRRIRGDQLVERQKDEEERHFRTIESEKRVREFKERASARKEQRDEWERVLRDNEHERQMRLEQEAGFVYKEALKAYKKQQWEQARQGFLEAQEILPGHWKSEKYLVRLDRDMQKAEMKRRVKIEKDIERQREKEAVARKVEEKRQLRLLEEDRKKQVAKQEKQAEAVYKFAVSLYRKGDYALAKDKFREVEDISPDYKSVQKYLGRVNNDIAGAQGFSKGVNDLANRRQLREQQIVQQREEEKLRQLLAAEEKQRHKDLSEESLARKRDRDEWEKTIRQIEVENQKRLKRQAQSTYEEALRYYKSGWYEQAKEAFAEVESTMPGYKSTRRYIARAEQNIQKEGKLDQDNEIKIQEYLDREEALLKTGKRRVGVSAPEKLDDMAVRRAAKQKQKEFSKQAEIKYRQALALYKANKFIDAKLKFIEVESFSPGYKATSNYLKRIDKKMSGNKMIDNRDHLVKRALLLQEDGSRKDAARDAKMEQKMRNRSIADQRKELKAQRQLIQKRYNKQFNQMYNRAIKFYKSGSYEQAQKLFVQIERMKPGYKRAASYLKKANAKIEKGFQKRNTNVATQSHEPKTRDTVIGDALDVFEQRL